MKGRGVTRDGKKMGTGALSRLFQVLATWGESRVQARAGIFLGEAREAHGQSVARHFRRERERARLMRHRRFGKGAIAPE